ncbi:MAG: glycosyltransferase family 4 protein [Fimbriimonadales bacterium]
MKIINKNGSDTPSAGRVAILGNYSPRRCGIATFTEDLAESLVEAGSDVFVIAMDDRPESYNYPDIVSFQVMESELKDYRAAADYVQQIRADVLCVQHEFGIFGGLAGSHLLELLERVSIPIITTLHTVLRNPDAHQMRVMGELDRLSSRFVVMSERGRDYLIDVYGVDSKRIDVIHHGIHALPKSTKTAADRRTILTFGLLGPDKGIENVISALPEVVKEHDVEYVVVGATHPNLVAQHGESYRASLVKLADDLGVSDHVKFVDKFVTKPELAAYMDAATIYVTPYNKLEQITSGTLAYAVGTGQAVISSPYWYAEELLADGRGVLVPPRDFSAIATQLNRLLSNEDTRKTIASRALEFGKQMLWPNVAKAYQDAFRVARPQRRAPVSRIAQTGALPQLDLGHLRTMTDDTGMFQHATYAIPNRKEGYCVDDNARALQFVCMALSASELPLDQARGLAYKYLSFIDHAFNPEVGRFRNFMSYDRRWLEIRGSDDSHGRTLRALGLTSRLAPDLSSRELATELFDRGLPAALNMHSPRALAFTTLGVIERLSDNANGRTSMLHLRDLSEVLESSFNNHAVADWPWFEDSVTYSNAVMPHALLAAGDLLGDKIKKDIGIEALKWLSDVQTDDQGRFLPIGSNGFKVRGGGRARFDQQPVEAWTSISAYSAAYRITGDANWLELARSAFGWFLGDNHLGVAVYDTTTGGCRDGVHRDRLNENQGAESTLAYLMSLCEWKQITKSEVRRANPIVHSM